MSDEIETFMKLYFSPQQYDLLTDAFQILGEFEVENYMDSVTELLLSSDDAGEQDTATCLYNKIHDYINSIFAAHDIKVNEDTSLEQANILARALLTLQNFEDGQSIVSHLMVCNNDVDNFCEVLTLVTHKSSVYFMQYIEEVSGSLISALIEMHREPKSAEEYDLKQNATHLENVIRLKVLAQYTEFRNTVGFKLIQSNIPLGETFEYYARSIITTLADMDKDALATEFVVLLAMSSDGIYSPLDTFRKWCHDHFDNINLITKVDVALIAQLAKLDTLQGKVK